MNYSNIEALSESINIIFNLYRNFEIMIEIGEKAIILNTHPKMCTSSYLEYPENNHIILGA